MDKSTCFTFDIYCKHDGRTLHLNTVQSKDSNLFTLSLLSLMLTFNFSVGRFVYFFEFGRSVCDLWLCISGFSRLHLCITLNTNRESLL